MCHNNAVLACDEKIRWCFTKRETFCIFYGQWFHPALVSSSKKEYLYQIQISCFIPIKCAYINQLLGFFLWNICFYLKKFQPSNILYTIPEISTKHTICYF